MLQQASLAKLLFLYLTRKTKLASTTNHLPAKTQRPPLHQHQHRIQIQYKTKTIQSNMQHTSIFQMQAYLQATDQFSNCSIILNTVPCQLTRSYTESSQKSRKLPQRGNILRSILSYRVFTKSYGIGGHSKLSDPDVRL